MDGSERFRRDSKKKKVIHWYTAQEVVDCHDQQSSEVIQHIKKKMISILAETCSLSKLFSNVVKTDLTLAIFEENRETLNLYKDCCNFAWRLKSPTITKVATTKGVSLNSCRMEWFIWILLLFFFFAKLQSLLVFERHDCSMNIYKFV